VKLGELEPRWFAQGEGRHGMGVSFLCPHCRRTRIPVPFAQPLDGGPPLPGATWERTGTTFDDLTLQPSISFMAVAPDGDNVIEHWHGHVTKGKVA